MTKQKGVTREQHHFTDLCPCWANMILCKKSNPMAAWMGGYVHPSWTNSWDPNKIIESRCTLGMNPDDHMMGIRLHQITHPTWPPGLSDREANFTKVTNTYRT